MLGSGSVTLGAGVANSLTVGSNNGGGTFSGNISETGSFIKVGAGTQTLSGSNSWTAGTQINGGVLRVSSTTSNLGNGQIQINGGTLESTATLNNLKGIQLNAGGGSTVFSGDITDPGGLTKEGSHTLTLSGNNSYEGPTTINEGILSINSNSNLGENFADLVFGGGTLRITDNAVDLGAGRSITLNSGGGTIRLNDEGGVAVTIPGVISGVGGLTINADNEEMATLSGVNTYQGGTIVEDALLRVSQNANLGADIGDVTLAGGILRTTASFTNLHPIVLVGSGSIDVEVGTLTQSAGISGTGNLFVGGPGTMVLTEPAIHDGNTNIGSNATLLFGSGELPDAFDVTVNGIWDLNGVSDTIDGLFGSGTVLLGGGTLTVGEADGDGNFGGSIQGSRSRPEAVLGFS